MQMPLLLYSSSADSSAAVAISFAMVQAFLQRLVSWEGYPGSHDSDFAGRASPRVAFDAWATSPDTA